MAMPLKITASPVSLPVGLLAMKNHLRVDLSMTDDDVLITSMTAAATRVAENIRGEGFVKQSWTFGCDIFPYLGNIDSAPSRSSYGPQGNFGYAWSSALINNQSFIVPKGPVISVDSINYFDPQNAPQVVTPPNYFTDLLSEPARICPNPGFTWPAVYFRPNAVQLNFTIGYQEQMTAVIAPSTNHTVTLPTPTGSDFISDIVSVVDADLNPITFTFTAQTNNVVTLSGSPVSPVTVVYNVSNTPPNVIMAIKLLVAAWYENREEFITNMNSSSTSIASVPLGFRSLLDVDRSQRFGYTGSGH
jgi:hypothetical protein